MLVILYSWTLFSGLGSSLMGALWPVMYPDFGVSLSAIGVFSWIGSIVGLISNLSAGWFLRKFGASRTTTICAIVSALVLLGYTLGGEFWLLCLLSIPGSIAGGLIGIAMNNYMALHYPSRHMSWMHCMWGVGSIIMPNIVSFTLRQGYNWRINYWVVFAAWMLWAIALIAFRHLWKSDSISVSSARKAPSMSLKLLLRIRGVKEAVGTFFCYNSLEQAIMMWMSSYLVLHSHLTEDLAATYASLFFLGITIGRMLNGFLTVKVNDDNLIRLGFCLIFVGVLLMLLPLGQSVTLAGLLVIGLGCAPVCPCLLHSTPRHFGEEHSQALVGVQVAASTLGNCILPSLFGLVASHISISLLPVYVLLCLGVMAFSHYRLVRLSATGHVAA